MGRLISLLVVVAIMAVMWLAMADGVTPPDDCVDLSTATITIPEGLENIVEACP